MTKSTAPLTFINCFKLSVVSNGLAPPLSGVATDHSFSQKLTRATQSPFDSIIEGSAASERFLPAPTKMILLFRQPLTAISNPGSPWSRIWLFARVTA